MSVNKFQDATKFLRLNTPVKIMTSLRLDRPWSVTKSVTKQKATLKIYFRKFLSEVKHKTNSIRIFTGTTPLFVPKLVYYFINAKAKCKVHIWPSLPLSHRL